MKTVAEIKIIVGLILPFNYECHLKFTTRNLPRISKKESF